MCKINAPLKLGEKRLLGLVRPPSKILHAANVPIQKMRVLAPERKALQFSSWIISILGPDSNVWRRMGRVIHCPLSSLLVLVRESKHLSSTVVCRMKARLNYASHSHSNTLVMSAAGSPVLPAISLTCHVKDEHYCTAAAVGKLVVSRFTELTERRVKCD